MAMDADDLAQEIMDEINEIDDPGDAAKAFSKALKAHIEDNCEVDYSWSALRPPPPPPPEKDSTTDFTSEVTFPNFDVGNPESVDAWGPMITTAVAGGIIKHPSEFLVPPGSFAPIPMTITESDADNMEDAWKHVAKEIVDGIKNMINPTPLPGSHPPYVVPTPGAIMTGIS